MAMVGKRFQRTTSMSQIGAGSSLHAEKAKAQNYHQQQEAEAGEHPPAKQWEILKNAEAMMMMMMATSGGITATQESAALERPALLNMAAAATANKTEPAQHPHTGVCPCSPATGCAVSKPMSSPAAFILPAHHFLDACFYCKRRLRPERDIFIYRGDAAFCTEECRHRQIVNDETHS